MEGYPAAGSPPVITVVTPGAAPRKQLRYTVAAAQKARMDMATTMSMATNMGGMSVPMDMPTMKMTVDLGVTAIAPNGDITYDLAFTGLTMDSAADTNPAIAAALQGMAAGITSIKGSATVSSRGVTKSTKLDVADPAMKQLLGQMTSSVENLSMPFPEEAVGVGARWEVRQALTGGGQTVFQKSECELVSIEGSAVSMKVTTEQTAPPQSVNNPALPAGAEMYLDKMSGSGTGTVVVHLDSLVPTSTLESTTSTAMTMNMSGQAISVTVDGRIKITIAPGK
jgi:predicted peroxiredoxin